jgi:hypothetical protein
MKIRFEITAQHFIQMSNADKCDLLGGYLAENDFAMSLLCEIVRLSQTNTADIRNVLQLGHAAERLSQYLLDACELRDGEALQNKVANAVALAELKNRIDRSVWVST